jgi:hypothetical protein
MKTNYRFSYLLALSFLLFPIAQSYSQTNYNSAYSNYGLGDLSNNTDTRNFSMGGITQGIRGYYNINHRNPASYTAFDSLSFVFEGAMYSNITTHKIESSSEQASNAGLAYLTFGFPITHWMSASFGVLPYSMTGYNIYNITTDPMYGKVNQVYSGDGGSTQYYIGTGFKLSKNLSLGVNAWYLSGNLENSKVLSFQDSAYAFNTRVKRNIFIGDINFTAGLQYSKVYGKSKRFTAGLTYGHGKNMGITNELLVETLFGGLNNSNEYYKDTIYYQSPTDGKLYLPMVLGGGFAIEKSERWLVGADVEYGFWQDYKLNDVSDSLRNSLKIKVGGELIPSSSSISKYWQKVRYRAGFHYSKSYLKLKNTGIDEFGLSFGMGLPIKRLATTVNIGMEFGKRGTVENNLIQDNYFQFRLGISITERWFVKRKYN